MNEPLHELIEQTTLSSLAANLLICQECGVVDYDLSRMEVGRPCGSCGRPSRSGRIFPPLNVAVIADLMRDAYLHDRPRTEDVPIKSALAVRQDAAVIIYFCTMDEALLFDCLRNLTLAKGLEVDSLKNTDGQSRRRDKDFRRLAGHSWGEAVNTCGVLASWEFLVRVRKVRDKFVHGGNPWVVSAELSTACIDHFMDLLDLYRRIHNDFVRPHWKCS